MADPTKYFLGYSFAGFQASNPAIPLPAQNVDNEFLKVQSSIGETIDALKSIRRSDGKLQAGLITKDSLPVELLTGLKPANPWVAGKDYSVDDVVTVDITVYRCIVAHTASSTFAPDLTANRWSQVMNFSSLAAGAGGPASGITFTSGTSGLTATNVQAAIEELGTTKAPVTNAAFTGTFTINAAVPWTNANFDPNNKADATTVNSLLGSKADQAAVDQALAAKASLSSPAFTGTPTAPTREGTNTSDAIATTYWVRAQGYVTGAGFAATYAPKSTAVTDIRLGATVTNTTGVRPAGHIEIGRVTINPGQFNEQTTYSYKPIQKLVNGAWSTITG